MNLIPVNLTNIFSNLNGIISWKNLNSQYIGMNHEAMQLFGFKENNFFMSSDLNLKGRVSENANDFIKQDKYVIENKKSLNVLDINYFGDFGLSLFRTSKQPIFDENNLLLGILVHCVEIKHPGIISNLLKMNKYDIKTYNQVNSYYNNSELDIFTKKEKLILFFIIRGKTAKDISEITNNSKRTIEAHISNMKEKLNVPSISSLIEFAIYNDFLKYIPEEMIKSFNTF